MQISVPIDACISNSKRSKCVSICNNNTQKSNNKHDNIKNDERNKKVANKNCCSISRAVKCPLCNEYIARDKNAIRKHRYSYFCKTQSFSNANGNTTDNFDDFTIAFDRKQVKTNDRLHDSCMYALVCLRFVYY